MSRVLLLADQAILAQWDGRVPRPAEVLRLEDGSDWSVEYVEHRVTPGPVHQSCEVTALVYVRRRP